MATKWKNFEVTKDGDRMMVNIKSPPANTLSSEALKELSIILGDCDDRRDIDYVELAGSAHVGRKFSSGADLRELKEIVDETDDNARKDLAYEFSRRGQLVVRQILAMSPGTMVTANLSGSVLGGGMELALACHERKVIRGTSESLLIGLPETTLGLVPGWGGTVLLPLIISSAHDELNVAKGLIANGVFLNYFTAKEYGLVEEVAFGKVSESPRQKIVSPWAKQLVEECFGSRVLSWDLNDLEDAFQYETLMFVKAMEHADAKEGISAFLEKREPNFES